jgi:hypothetical protein
MTTRYTAILAAVTLVVGVYVVGFDRGPSDPARDLQVVPIAKEASEVVALDIDSASGKISLERHADGYWQMKSPVSDRADGQKIDELLGDLLRLKKLESFEENAPSESTLGLNGNALSIGITTAAGESGTLGLGADAAIEGDIYARWSDDAPFLCWSDARDLASLPFGALRDVRLLAIPPDKMRRVKIKDETEASLVVDQLQPKQPWRVLKPFETMADQASVDKRLTILASMGAKDFIDDPNGEVAAAFAKGAITVSIWKHGERGATTELKLAASEDGQSGFARVSDRDAVFSIDPKFLNDLTLNPNDVRDRRLATFNPKSVFGLVILAKPNLQVAIQQDNTGWQLINGEQKVPASRQRVLELLKSLAAEEVEEFVADAVVPADLAKWGLNDPQLTIRLATVQQDPENPVDEEGNPNLIQVPLNILVSRVLPEDQPVLQYFATVEGTGTVVRINPAFKTMVPVRALAYRSLYLWPAFARERLRTLKIWGAPGSPVLDLEYLPATADWAGKVGGEDVTARIDKVKADDLVLDISVPLRAERWVTQEIELAQAALQTRPIKHLRFALEDLAGKRFDFGLDIAPMNPNPNVRNSFFYARTVGSSDICVISRETLESLERPLLKGAE